MRKSKFTSRLKDKDEGKFTHVLAKDSFQVDYADGKWTIIHKRGDKVMKEGTIPSGQRFISAMGVNVPEGSCTLQ